MPNTFPFPAIINCGILGNFTFPYIHLPADMQLTYSGLSTNSYSIGNTPIPDGYFRLAFKEKQLLFPTSAELTDGGIAAYFGVSTFLISV